VARLALVEELSYNVKSNRAQLEHQQFDLIVKLLNCALQVCSLLGQFLAFSAEIYYLYCLDYDGMVWHWGCVVFTAET
jgi:hypothetical protein